MVTSLQFSPEEKAAYFHKLVGLLLDVPPKPIILAAVESSFPYGFPKGEDDEAQKRVAEERPGPQRRRRIRRRGRGLRSTIVHGHEDPYYVALQVLYQEFHRRHPDRFLSGITTDVGPDLCSPLKAADCIAYILGWCFRSRMPGPNDEQRDALLRPLFKRLCAAQPVVEFMGTRIDVASVRDAFDDMP